MAIYRNHSPRLKKKAKNSTGSEWRIVPLDQETFAKKFKKSKYPRIPAWGSEPTSNGYVIEVNERLHHYSRTTIHFTCVCPHEIFIFLPYLKSINVNIWKITISDTPLIIGSIMKCQNIIFLVVYWRKNGLLSKLVLCIRTKNLASANYKHRGGLWQLL